MCVCVLAYSNVDLQKCNTVQLDVVHVVGPLSKHVNIKLLMYGKRYFHKSFGIIHCRSSVLPKKMCLFFDNAFHALCCLQAIKMPSCDKSKDNGFHKCILQTDYKHKGNLGCANYMYASVSHKNINDGFGAIVCFNAE